MTTRTFGYGRVSTTEQTAENQRQEIERAGYVIEDRRWLADTISGKTCAMQRPQFKTMIDRIEEGDTLVVTKLDRLGRDAHDIGATIKLLAERGIEVIVLQLGKLDLTSAAGKMMLTILAAMAEMERDVLVERTQAGLARAKKEGKKLGPKMKTTQQQRDEIVAKHAKGAGDSISALSRQYGVSRATILGIVTKAK